MGFSDRKKSQSKLGSYLRKGIAYTALSAGIALSSAPSTTSRDFYVEPAIKLRPYEQKIDLSETLERLQKEAMEVAKKSYSETGQYDLEWLGRIQQDYYDYIRYAKLSSEQVLRPFVPIIVKVARSEKTNPAIIGTIMSLESDGYVGTMGNHGEMGLMQLKGGLNPRDYARIFDPEFNIREGTKRFNTYLKQFHGNLRKALEAYNCGPTKVINRKVPGKTKEYSEKAISHIPLFEKEYLGN